MNKSKFSKQYLCYIILPISISACNSGSTSASPDPISISCNSIGVESIEECIITSSSNTAYGFNNMPYALCVAVSCDFAPGSTVASCNCPVMNESGWMSTSLSPTNYSSAQPTSNLLESLQTVQSNYSQANDPPPATTCTFDTPHPWANCFGTRCSVFSDGTQANCQCPVVYSNSFHFQSIGGTKCDTSESQIWSGNNNTYNYDEMVLLYQTLYPDAPILTTAN